jgi:hypothetical protein
VYHLHRKPASFKAPRCVGKIFREPLCSQRWGGEEMIGQWLLCSYHENGSAWLRFMAHGRVRAQTTHLVIHGDEQRIHNGRGLGAPSSWLVCVDGCQ